MDQALGIRISPAAPSFEYVKHMVEQSGLGRAIAYMQGLWPGLVARIY